MESTHTIIESVREGTITPDDAMRILVPQYAPNNEFVETLDSVMQYMRDHVLETGQFPEEFIDFRICDGTDDYDGCFKLMVWDDVREDFVHLERSDCHWHKLEELTGATQG